MDELPRDELFRNKVFGDESSGDELFRDISPNDELVFRVELFGDE